MVGGPWRCDAFIPSMLITCGRLEHPYMQDHTSQVRKASSVHLQMPDPYAAIDEAPPLQV